MSFTLCTSGAIVIKAGKNVSSSAATSSALLEQFSDQSEATFNLFTRYDWIANFSKIGTNYKQAIGNAVSSIAGIELVKHDMSGYTNRGEAEDVVNILHDMASRIIRALNDDKYRTKVGATDT